MKKNLYGYVILFTNCSLHTFLMVVAKVLSLLGTNMKSCDNKCHCRISSKNTNTKFIFTFTSLAYVNCKTVLIFHSLYIHIFMYSIISEIFILEAF